MTFESMSVAKVKLLNRFYSRWAGNKTRELLANI